jgi:hypothetical protein
MVEKERMNRKIILTLVLIIAVSTLSIITAKPAFAQTSIPTPYVPEFSMKYITSSYTGTSTSEYTGATVTNTYINNTVQIVILNQAFNPNALENGTTLSLAYSVGAKPHFATSGVLVINNMPAIFPASSSQYTVITLGFSEDNSSSSVEAQIPPIPNGSQIDFQVQAIVGFYVTVPYHPFGEPFITEPIQQFSEVATSAWSNYLTITVLDGSTSTPISSTSSYPTLSPNVTSSSTSVPTVTPQNTTIGIQTKKGAGFNWIEVALFIALAVIVALVVVVVALLHGHRKTANLSK